MALILPLAPCGSTLIEIGEDVTEQLALVPAAHFVIQIVRKEYACACHECGVRTAPAPAAVRPGAQSFEAIARVHDLVPVLGNDHCRRKFVEAERVRGAVPGSVASKALAFYKRLYRIERGARREGLTPSQRHQRRRRRAEPIWEAFVAWAREVHGAGVRDRGTRLALEYLLRHERGLRRYLEDGRLPISNIASEHVAKTIAVPRRNFLCADTPALCADTPAGASASALYYSLIETARANGHEPRLYLTVVLSELPGATDVEAIEALLPWRLTAEEVDRRYAARPKPTGAAKKASA